MIYYQTEQTNMSRPLKYDWDKWLSSPGVVLLFRKRDYHCSQSSMIQRIRNVASARRIPVTCRDQGHYIELVVRETEPSRIVDDTSWPSSQPGSPTRDFSDKLEWDRTSGEYGAECDPKRHGE
jgi:hypothetical protein